MQTIRITTSQNIDIDYEVAGVGDRLLGYLIDMGIFILLLILTVLVGAMAGNGNSNLVVGIMTIVFFVLYVFYDLVCEIFFNGQSVGKMIMKIKVISLDGGRATVGQYFLRWIFRIIDFGFTSGLCALITAAVTKNCQRLGDIVAGTTLIKTSPRTNISNVAFTPVYEGYISVFPDALQLKDKDVALLHEVLENYRISGNAVVVFNAARQLEKILSVNIPAGMDDYLFLQTLIKDYNHLMAVAATAETL